MTYRMTFSLKVEGLWAVQINECRESFRGAFYSWILTPEEIEIPVISLANAYIVQSLCNSILI